MVPSLAAFFGVCAVVIASPGPDTALTIRNAARGGAVGGIWTAFGVASGQLVWATATSAGLVAILLASAAVFAALKYLGAIYLVYLGVVSLRSALRRRTATSADSPARSAQLSKPRAFVQGIVNDLANPKMAIFFSSLLPQFVAHGSGGWDFFVASMQLGLAFSAMTFAWLSLYAIVIAKMGSALRVSPIGRVLDAVMGSVLVGLGVRVAME
jgi:threonine/homoserine/homoserine lactone efflux protein